MRIPSGDLAPARRRRYGGSYGQRRRRLLLGVLLAGVLIAVVAGAAYVLQRDDSGAAARRVAGARPSPTPCASVGPSRGPALVLPAATSVRLVLLNGTPRNGLGKAVGAQLVQRGFLVTGTGNSARPQPGASTVQFGPGAQGAATLLSRTVPGSVVVGNAKAPAGSVQVVLGTGFIRLRTPAEVAALARPVAAASAGAASCR